MRKRVITIIFALIGFGVGANVMPLLWTLVQLGKTAWLNNVIVDGLIGAVIFAVIAEMVSGWIIKQLDSVEKYLSTKSASFLLFGVLGTIIGLVLAAIISILFYNLPGPWNVLLPLVLMVLLGYFGFQLGTTRRAEWRRLFGARGQREREKKENDNAALLDRRVDDNFRKYKLLDTSVIIDGRVQAIAKTGFMEGTLLVPTFVVHELQLISDSADALKRGRGRRGLDIINQMKADDDINVEMYDGDFDDMTEVDSKLLKLAKMLDGIVVTNDYNLNKVAQFQNVPVLNINELANALKPDLIPGEPMTVTVIKSGTERQQGVAYMEDGTMVVVEDGQFYMNKPLNVIVTSAIQTAAGRMIFAKPAHQQQSIKGDAGKDNGKSAGSNKKKKA